MATNWNPSLDDDDDEDEAVDNKPKNTDPKSLRAALRKALADREALQKIVDEQNANARRGAIEKSLADKKLNPKLAKLVPVDVDSDKIDAWLDDYKDLFTPVPSSTDESSDGPGDEVEEQEDVQALQRLARASGSSLAPSRTNDVLAQINDPNLTRDQLVGMINSAGGGYGNG